MGSGKTIYIIGTILFLAFIGSLIPDKCAWSGCDNSPHGSSRYCTKHDLFYDGGSSYKTSYTSNSYSTGYSSSKTSSSKSSNVSYKSNTSNGYTYMPDCDDYVSYDDFMDDWDGYMPDGSDAEDYWDNW